ncbi:AI-2E family transporter [Thermococcus sp. 21S9]|uniref:AI-2E family transporter n=1 Tax=Thermococcus sp. 21S9 TaxID=1638223 RepID=UPI00143B6C1F|nr:AI-2E family transporter [Thermococcus sp. 21S9]NJE54777.1 AI-2E family transporter [Thermococcus sp. 21S9]
MKAEELVWGAVIAIILYVTWRVVHPLVTPIFFGFVLAYASYPIQRRLSVRLGRKRSALVISLSMLVFGGALTLELLLVSVQVLMSFYEGIVNVFNWLLTLPLPSDVLNFLQHFQDQVVPRIADYLSRQAFSLPSYLLQLFVFFFTYYYALAYGEEIRAQIYALLPEKNRELGEEILRSVNKTLSALVRAWLLLNVAKGILMTIGFIIFRVSDLYTAIVAGFLTFAFSFVPLFEGWMIWLAAAIYFAVKGAYLHALGIALYGFILVSPMPDYTIRPMLVARDTELDETLVFIGMIGGTWAMGLKGLIIGPIVLNLLLVLLKEWKRLTESSRRPSQAPQELSSRPPG